MAALRIPRPISPQAHRIFDLVALPAMFALALWMRRRNTTAATVFLLTGAIEGATQLVTDYTVGARPRGPLRWISLRDHLRITGLYGLFVAGLAITLKGLRASDRRLILAMSATAPTLAVLSDPGESEAPGIRRG